ncbi:hypothetical protein GZL_06157 [Streptomyces sp. 769]|nr:hypothetical protein GZL_06157 [Streptomyces sp. 769]
MAQRAVTRLAPWGAGGPVPDLHPSFEVVQQAAPEQG